MNIDLPQSSVAAEFQPPPADGDLVSTPRDAGFPIDQLSSPPPPPPLPSYQMNVDPPQSPVAVELQPPSGGDLVSTTVRLVPPPLPGQTDRARSAVEELEAWRLPDLASTPTGRELVEKHLRPASERLLWKHFSQPIDEPAVVNADLPITNPWELPGVKHEEGRIETHYLTDHHKLCFAHNPFLEKCSQKTSEKDKSEKIKFTLETPDGHWTQRDSMAETELGMIIWVKKTFVFHTKTGIKTKWIMDVYYLINRIFRRIEDDLVLCHVFEQDSPAYDPRPKCPTFHQGRCNGLSKVTVHHYQDQRSCPRFIPFTPNPGFLVGDPDPDTSTQRGVPPTADHAESKKRKVGSDVWEYFTKIFARDIKGNVLTFAVCNHCSKVLTGGSSGGTTHLKNHTCACKLKPVLAGRNQKASVSVSSS